MGTTSRKIVVVGIGYVGLANAILLAQNNQVVAVDVLQQRVDMIKNRQSPLVDKEIEEYLATKQLDLRATTDLQSAIKDADFAIIATPTNYDSDKNYFDTSMVEDVAQQIVELNKTVTIVIKSTIPVGFTNRLIEQLHYDNVIFSPEFLREGKALYDNLNPSRIIIGVAGTNATVLKRAKQFAQLLSQGAVKKQIPILTMRCKEAEAVKLFANTYLALRISYFNELDTYAELHGLDTKSIIEGVCLDPRIGEGYNNPSFGYGGYCLPKDTKQLVANYDQIPANIVRAIVWSNRARKDHIAEQVYKYVNSLGKENVVVGIYRLTMKANSDNFRQSAIQGVIKRLEKYNLDILIYEPMAKTDEHYGHKITKDFELFKNTCDIIVANRMEAKLTEVTHKVYTRDTFARD